MLGKGFVLITAKWGRQENGECASHGWLLVYLTKLFSIIEAQWSICVPPVLKLNELCIFFTDCICVPYDSQNKTFLFL
jgi:hypothetical protein